MSVFLLLIAASATIWADERLNTLMAEGKYSKAIEYIDQMIPAPTRTVEVWIILAEAYDKSGADKEKATRALAEAQRVNPSDPQVYRGLGDFFNRQKNYSEALKHYQKWYLLDRSARAAENIAICAARLKMWDKARDAAESAISIDPNFTESRKILSEIYFSEKDYNGAAKQLEAIVERVKDDVNYYKKLARCYEETNSRDKLAMVDPRIIELDKKDIVSRRRMVEYYLEKKDLTASFNLLRELAILTPEDAKVFKHLYQISADRGQKKDAILYLKNYLVLDSSDAATYKALGDMQYEQKNMDEALEAYRKALRLNPGITGIYRPYLAIVLDKKLEDEAVAVSPKAIAANEMDGPTYGAVGNIYKKKNRCDQALDLFASALKSDPKNVAVLTSLADCQAAVGKNSEAVITYEQVVLLNPQATAEYKALGDLQMKLNKKDEAVSAYRKYLDRTPGDERVAGIIGEAAHDKKQHKDAIAYLEKVKDPRLQGINYFMDLGDSYYQTGNFAKAAENYAKARAKGPAQPAMEALLKPLADSYEKTGNQIEAAKAYEAYVKLPGIKDADASFKQASLRETADRKTAMGMYLANTTLFPQDARNFVRLGILYSEDAETAGKAVDILQKASVLAPNDPVVWQKLSDAYHKANNGEKELAASVKLLSLDPENLEANRRAGTLLYKKKQFGQAIPYLEKVAAKTPQDIEILLCLADAYQQSKNPQKAQELFARAKDQQPDNVKIWLALIAAAEGAGQKDKAAEARAGLADLDKKIVSKDSKNVESRVRLADYLFDKGETDAAYGIYKDLANLTPRDKEVFQRLVEIAQKKGNRNDAIGYLRQYVSLDAVNAKAHLLLGNLLYDQKDSDAALAEFRTAWKLDPALKGYFGRYTELVVAKKLDDEAIAVINAAIKAGEADTKAYVTLGKIYLVRKQYPNAIAMLKKASNDDPKNMEVLAMLGGAQAASGDVANAIITYEQVVMINPQADEEYKALGDLQARQGKADDAMKSYKKYLEKSPNDEKVARQVGLNEYAKKQYPSTVRYLEMVKSPALQDQEYLLALGDAYYKQGNCQKTTAIFSQLRTKKSSETLLKAILRPLGECYEKTGDNQKAAEAYEAYTSLPGVQDADAAYLKAFLREKTDPKAAEALYLANTKAYPKDNRSFVRLGLSYADNPATLGRAADLLNQASILNPKDVVVLEKLAQVWGVLKNEDRELAAYKKLLVLDPQNLDANRRVGAIQMKKKQYGEAITNLEIVQTVNPQDAEVMLMLSEGYLKTGRQDKGIDLLAKAQNIKKDNPDLMAQLYGLYKQANKLKEAEGVIKQLIGLKKENKYRVMYAEDLITQKRYADAQSIADEIKKADPMNIDGLMLLGRIQSMQAKYDDAVESFKMVSYINENYAPALYERGEIYRKQSSYERAVTFYTKALQANARYGLAELGLALVAKAQKDTPGYQTHLNKAKALSPDEPEVQSELKAANK
jgi:tetratricopeptide (TPR) repeat protein